MNESTQTVLATLAERGLLLQQDQDLPNVVRIVTRETVKGSWWSHPGSRLIFRVLSELADHPDVLLVKLLRGKVTLVHRRLWPALLTAVSRSEPWQLRGLSSPARELLASVDQSSEPAAASGPVVKELERRLLVHTQERHTESGRHALLVQSWSLWARQADVKPLRSPAAARRTIETAAEGLGAPLSALPWFEVTG